MHVNNVVMIEATAYYFVESVSTILTYETSCSQPLTSPLSQALGLKVTNYISSDRQGQSSDI